MENYLFYLFAFLLSTVNKTSPIEINITTNITAEPNTGIILIKNNIPDTANNLTYGIA